MKFTNKFNLPQAFVRAVENDPYDKGKSDFSASQISGWQTPRCFALLKQFENTLEVDVSTRVATTIGQGTHVVAERAARPVIDICEERLFGKFEVDGKVYIVSAQLDLYETDTCILHDWKTTKAAAFLEKYRSGKKPDWIAQLNIAAEILRQNGHQPKKLVIIALLKDWDYWAAGKDGMPKTEVISVDLPMWSSAETIKFIQKQIRERLAALKALPLCSSKEALGGSKCARYCDAASVCTQYKGAQKTGLLLPETKPVAIIPERPKKSGWAQMLEAKGNGSKITLDKAEGE